MSSPVFILVPRETGWRVALVRAGGVAWSEVACDSAPEARAEAARQELRRLGYDGGGVMLALPGDWCIPVAIGGAEADQTLPYRLEEKLPLAAEEMAAGQAGGLAVAARLAPLKALVEALEARGVTVQSIAPAALLCAQRLAGSGDAELLALSNHASVELVWMRQGKPEAWWSAAPDDVRVAVELSGPSRIRANDPAGLAAALQRSDIEPISATVEDELALAGAEALSGRRPALIELRRDALGAMDHLRQHRRALNALLACAAIGLLLLAAAMQVRGYRYQQQAAEDEAQVRRAFAAAYPGWEMPPDVTMVLQAEHRRMTQQREALPVEARESALPVLERVMARLPTGGGYRLENATFGPAGFELSGRATSAEHIAALETALRQGGAELAPAESQRGGDGLWTFVVRGKAR